MLAVCVSCPLRMQGEWTTTGRKGRKKLQGDLDLILAPGDGRSKPSPRTGDRGTSRAGVHHSVPLNMAECSHTHTHTHTHTYACTHHSHMYTYTYTHHSHMYMYIHAYTHHSHVHIHIHTTHTCTQHTHIHVHSFTVN